MSLWDDIQRSARVNRCRCELAPGMDRTSLLPLGGGCTMPLHCCPTLDKYRRLTTHAPVPLEAEPPRKRNTAPAKPKYDPFAALARRG